MMIISKKLIRQITFILVGIIALPVSSWCVGADGHVEPATWSCCAVACSAGGSDETMQSDDFSRDDPCIDCQHIPIVAATRGTRVFDESGLYDSLSRVFLISVEFRNTIVATEGLGSGQTSIPFPQTLKALRQVVLII
jgi:hypothetical protein